MAGFSNLLSIVEAATLTKLPLPPQNGKFEQSVVEDRTLIVLPSQPDPTVERSVLSKHRAEDMMSSAWPASLRSHSPDLEDLVKASD